MLSLPEPRTLLSLLLLGAAAAGTYFIAAESGGGRDRAKPELQLAYYLNSAQLSGTDADGTVLYTVTTRQARQNSETGSIELSEIVMDYGAPRGLPWNVRADRGRIPEDASVIELEGNVVAVSGADHPTPTVITTNTLSIDPATMLADTNDRVTLSFDERLLNARGMQANFETNNLKLLSDVNGKFVP